jgi:5-(carboxyamino)imidazole ribonucleotide synthase
VRIGVVGAGQLARMLALAGRPLGIEFMVYDPAADASAGRVAPLTIGAFDDRQALARFARRVDVLTFDWENVPAASLSVLSGGVVRPSSRALALSQDRLAEKRLFARLGIPTAPHASVGSLDGLRRAVRRVGLPGVLKTRRLGYDGKGQAWLRHLADVEAAYEALAGQPLIYEAKVRFRREFSLLAVRGADGVIACYPLAENRHEGGILRVTRAPYLDAALQAQAERHLRALLERLRYVGVLAVEFFEVDGRLVANETAARVHNSGHWTIEGAETSQFENHVRALAGLPLGRTEARGHSAMVNFVGGLPAAADVLAVPGAHFHDYEKAPRPGRKVGHATHVSWSVRARDRAARRLLALAREAGS